MLAFMRGRQTRQDAQTASGTGLLEVPCLEVILMHLEREDLKSLALVSKQFKSLVDVFYSTLQVRHMAALLAKQRPGPAQ